MKLPVSRFTVNGNSMQPTLQPGQDILSFNWFVKPKVGDVIVVRVNGKALIKRIHKVDDRTIFVTGDNANESTDSRDFGAVNMGQVVGKVFYTTNRHPVLPEAGYLLGSGSLVDCPQCGSPVIGIYGRKDAICTNCGFKLACCGEP